VEGGVKLSVVIPALNEEHGIGEVLKEIPIAELGAMDYRVEVVVVDNGSVDSTAHVACMHGATVVVQPMRGYGNAYKAGFAYATGDVVATGDADLTYPFADLPKILRLMEERRLEFVTTDRLSGLRDGAMTRTHVLGNWLLSLATKVLFRWPYKDSQSGMWIFRRYVWDALDVQSSGMPFSQELKIEAFVRGFRCAEVPIDYRARAGKAKLNTITDGLGNIAQLVRKRISLGLVPARAATVGERDASCIWHERWYDLESHSVGTAGERGPHVPLALLDGPSASTTSTDQRDHMVVWRAERRGRPAAEKSSVPAPAGMSQDADGTPGPARYIGPERRRESCAI
jgi:Glycosyl transferase family 2